MSESKPKRSKETQALVRSRGIYLLPNLFTTIALFAGYYAIVAALKGKFEHAAIAIFVAMLMDSLDGRVARLTNTQTAFGAQLDSLSDMVSFGVAPALVIYSWSLMTLGKFGWLASFIYTVSVALRLARFNTQPSSDNRYFQGLACPAAAGLLAGLIWVGYDYDIAGTSISVLVAALTITVGLLMISSIPYRSFKDTNLRESVPFIAIVAVVMVLVFISIHPPTVLFLGFLTYVASGPALRVWSLIHPSFSRKRESKKLK